MECTHNSYWRGVYGTCMACRAERAETALAQAEQERDEFKASSVKRGRELAEARAEVERLKEAAGILSDPDKRHWKDEWTRQCKRAEQAEADLARVRAAGLGMRSVLRPIYDYADLTESRRKEAWDAMAAWDQAALGPNTYNPRLIDGEGDRPW